MTISPVEIWIAIGLILIIVEFIAIPGIGFLFLGLGCLSTSLIIYYFPSIASYQIASIGLSSLAWLLLLWWPLQTFLYNKRKIGKSNYFDIIGMRVEVISEKITQGSIGTVSWSGTTMNAKLFDKEAEATKGEILYVVEVKGNVLLCSHTK